jgi:hypothetical protein
MHERCIVADLHYVETSSFALPFAVRSRAAEDGGNRPEHLQFEAIGEVAARRDRSAKKHDGLQIVCSDSRRKPGSDRELRRAISSVG